MTAAPTATARTTDPDATDAGAADTGATDPSADAGGTDIGESVAAAATEALGDLLGLTLGFVSDPAEPNAAYPVEDAASVEVPLSGGKHLSVVMTIPADGWQGVSPIDLAAGMAPGVASALGRVDGCDYAVGSPSPVAPGDTTPLPVDAPHAAVRFILSAPTGPDLPLQIVVGATPGMRTPDGAPVAPAGDADPGVAPAAFPDLTIAPPVGAGMDLQVLSDVSMDVTVELGRTVLQVRQLLNLTEGTVVELDRDAGAAVDVLVNGTLIARGDVVVIDDDLGVRITEIIER